MTMSRGLVMALIAAATACGTGTDQLTLSGRVARTVARGRDAAVTGTRAITHVMAVDPESASPHRSLARVGSDGSFELELEVGRPYVLVFVDDTAVGADMAVAVFRAGTLDTLSPQLAGHVTLGDVQIDPAAHTASPGVAYDDLLTQLGLSAAAAEYLGSIDDLSLRYANPDIDGDGTIALEGHHYFALDFHVRSNMRRGSATGPNFTVDDITDQFLPDDAVPVYNLTSA